MQWLQDPNQSNIDNLNNIIREASRHVKKNRSNIGELKIDELEISKISEIRIGLSMILRRVNIIKNKRLKMPNVSKLESFKKKVAIYLK
jgi:hypothetical protein